MLVSNIRTLLFSCVAFGSNFKFALKCLFLHLLPRIVFENMGRVVSVSLDLDSQLSQLMEIAGQILLSTPPLQTCYGTQRSASHFSHGLSSMSLCSDKSSSYQSVNSTLHCTHCYLPNHDKPKCPIDIIEMSPGGQLSSENPGWSSQTKQALIKLQVYPQ